MGTTNARDTKDGTGGTVGAGGAGRTGVWLVGARGSVATTVVAGAAAVRTGLAEPAGLVGETEAFADARLPALADLVFGGHDVLGTPLPRRAEQLAEAGVLPARLPTAVDGDLLAADAEIRQGADPGERAPQAETAARLVAAAARYEARVTARNATTGAGPVPATSLSRVTTLAVLAGLPRLAALGRPLLVGASRKRFVGELSGVGEPAARVFGSVGAHAAALARGARIFRVHDVRAHREALDVAWAVLRNG